MARIVVIAALAACDFTPAPPPAKQQPAAKPVATTPVTAPVATQPPPVAAQPATADFVTNDCVDAAAHVVDLTLAGVADPKERVVQERKRATMVRQTAEQCSKKPWSPAAIKCFAFSASLDKMRDCDKLIE